MFFSGYTDTHTQAPTKTQIASIPVDCAPVFDLEFEVPISDGYGTIGTAVITIDNTGNVYVESMSAAGALVVRISYITGKNL